VKIFYRNQVRRFPIADDVKLEPLRALVSHRFDLSGNLRLHVNHKDIRDDAALAVALAAAKARTPAILRIDAEETAEPSAMVPIMQETINPIAKIATALHSLFTKSSDEFTSSSDEPMTGSSAEELAWITKEHATRQFKCMISSWKAEHPRGSFEEFMLDIFPENTSMLPTGEVILDPRVEGPSWRGAFENEHQQEECSLCFEELTCCQSKEIVQTTCAHVYHLECLREWTIKNASCPICRRDISAMSGLCARQIVGAAPILWMDELVSSSNPCPQTSQWLVGLIDANFSTKAVAARVIEYQAKLGVYRQVRERQVAQLCAMGFAEEDVQQALIAAEGILENAVEMLTMVWGLEDEALDDF
jgi:hypothetical protein